MAVSQTRDFHRPGRSAAIAGEAMIATAHPLATAAGLDMMRRGGNAVDAAIAAAAVLGVVEPEQSGIGGDCFALVCPKGGGDIVALDGAGWAPAAGTADAYRRLGLRAMPFEGPHSVTVPGAVDAWCRLARDHGTRAMAELLAPAIRYAEQGHPIHERVAFDWAMCASRLTLDPNTARIHLPGGQAPAPGRVFRQPQLGATLRRIAAEGRDGFYRGPVAQDMVGYLRQLGGLHALDDFAAFESRYVRPLKSRYRGLDLHQCPPAGQGFTALLMLNILDQLDWLDDQPVSPVRLHALAEAAKRAYAERDAVVGDDPRSRRLVEKRLELGFAKACSDAIDPERASDLPLPAPRPANTSYLCAVDRERTAVSMINSVYQSYGSAITAPESGVVLQDRAAGFTLAEGHPNCVGPRKRPFHTIIPAMAMRNDRPVLLYGMVGGHFQPFGQAWILSNVVDYAMNPQAAIDLPRGFAFGEGYRLERGIPDAAAASLAAMGHNPLRWPQTLGAAHMIAIDWQAGTFTGGADSRADGQALGY
ncbi:MAG: gamma-glutamyltransferase family protein [Alphaproteobacteria bacterium]|nr:gamma-glutamyltransferase family protein [Alphaproteobacteria bacterium]